MAQVIYIHILSYGHQISAMSCELRISTAMQDPDDYNTRMFLEEHCQSTDDNVRLYSRDESRIVIEGNLGNYATPTVQ